MALRGHVFDKQLFSSDCCALVTDTFLNKHSGIIKGCNLSNTSETIYIDDGYFLVKGRPIQEEGGSSITVEAGDLAGIYCKLVCEIDMSQANTANELKQVNYKIIENSSDYPTLIQEDITDGGTIYQFELAQFRKTINGIEDFVDTRSFLNFDSIYSEVREEIKKIEEGSIFATVENLEQIKNEVYEETTLFEGFATGDFTLSDTIANYDAIKITYTSSTSNDVTNLRDLHTIEIPNIINNSYFFLEALQNGSATAGNRITFYTKAYDISENTFTVGKALNFDFYKNGSIVESDTQKCNIVKVIGLKKGGI